MTLVTNARRRNGRPKITKRGRNARTRAEFVKLFLKAHEKSIEGIREKDRVLQEAKNEHADLRNLSDAEFRAFLLDVVRDLQVSDDDRAMAANLYREWREDIEDALRLAAHDCWQPHWSDNDPLADRLARVAKRDAVKWIMWWLDALTEIANGKWPTTNEPPEPEAFVRRDAEEELAKRSATEQLRQVVRSHRGKR